MLLSLLGVINKPKPLSLFSSDDDDEYQHFGEKISETEFEELVKSGKSFCGGCVHGCLGQRDHMGTGGCLEV